jgi:uncharacterized membrane protein YhaH (DUF805 family)
VGLAATTFIGMTDNPGQAPPGWYPDPSGSPRQRYFDGEIWTDHYHDESAPAAPGGAAYAGGGGYAGGGAAQPALDPVECWKKVVLENYANFSGRARRAEYWWAYLITIGITVVLFILGAVIGDAGIILPVLFMLGMFIPLLAAGIRRLHDTNKSGWFYLLGFVPFGGIVLLVFMATDGERGANQYGVSPKY